MIDEVLNPFYLFQVAAVCLWMNNGYEKYAYCIFFISFWGVCESLYETVTNVAKIRELAHYTCDIEVQRMVNGETIFTKVSSDDLVPGDVIRVPENTLMPCDMILMTGTCIVNESMLTGESIPVIKQPISPIK